MLEERRHSLNRISAEHQHGILKAAFSDFTRHPSSHPSIANNQPSNTLMMLQYFRRSHNGRKVLSVTDIPGKQNIEASRLQRNLGGSQHILHVKN